MWGLNFQQPEQEDGSPRRVYPHAQKVDHAQQGEGEREWECLNKQLAAAAALAALTDICTTNIFRRPSFIPPPPPPYYSTSPYFFPDQMEHFQPISGIRSSRNHLFISSTLVLRCAHLENPFTAAHKLSSCIEKLQRYITCVHISTVS